jgi:hypothetical protein
MGETVPRSFTHAALYLTLTHGDADGSAWINGWSSSEAARDVIAHATPLSLVVPNGGGILGTGAPASTKRCGALLKVMMVYDELSQSILDLMNLLMKSYGYTSLHSDSSQVSRVALTGDGVEAATLLATGTMPRSMAAPPSTSSLMSTSGSPRSSILMKSGALCRSSARTHRSPFPHDNSNR